MAATKAPEYSHWLTIATIIFLIWALLFAGVRTWAKLKRSIPWSFYDNVFTLAFVIGFAQCISVFLSVSYGFGDANRNQTSSESLREKKALFASQILYVLSIGLSKCSHSLFLGSLTRNKQQKIPSIVIAAVCAIWTVVSIFIIALRGNLSTPWLVTNGSHGLYKRWLGVEASGAVLEIILWILSTALVWGLNMRLLKRLKVVGLFGLRLILIAIVAGRLYFLSRSTITHPNTANSSTYTAILAAIFTEAAMQYSLMAECMTCLKPFLQPFHSGYGFSTDSGLGSFSNPSRSPYAEFSNTGSRTEPEIRKPTLKISQSELKGRSRDGSTGSESGGRKHQRQSSRRRTRMQELENRMKLRADYSNFNAHIEADHTRSHGRRSDEDDIELLQRQSAGIQQTTTVSVVGEAAG